MYWYLSPIRSNIHIIKYSLMKTTFIFFFGKVPIKSPMIEWNIINFKKVENSDHCL